MEKLSDLMPNYRQVEDLESELALEEAKIAEEQRFEEDAETLQALGAPLEIGETELPEPTTGVLALLDIIKSPFVYADKEDDVISIHDYYKAIYVISSGRDAIKDIYSLRKSQDKLERAENIAEKSPEFFAVYLSVTQALSEQEAEFDAKCFEFGAELGVIDIEKSIKELSDYIQICFGGFGILPTNNDEKKTTDMT